MNKIDKGRLIRLKKCVALANIQANEKVLDLGCGDMFIKNLLPLGCKYLGIDEKGGSIAHNLEMGLPDKIIGRKFDIIFMTEILEHVENFKSLLVQCKDTLTDKGRIVISTPSNNRILYGDFFKGIGEDAWHIHCFRKTNMRNLARICGLKMANMIGTYIRIPPILPKYVVIPTNQTVYTEVIIYKLEPL